MKTARDAHNAHGEVLRHREVIISNNNNIDRNNPNQVYNRDESANVTIEHSALKHLKISTMTKTTN